MSPKLGTRLALPCTHNTVPDSLFSWEKGKRFPGSPVLVIFAKAGEHVQFKRTAVEGPQSGASLATAIRSSLECSPRSP